MRWWQKWEIVLVFSINSIFQHLATSFLNKTIIALSAYDGRFFVGKIDNKKLSGKIQTTSHTALSYNVKKIVRVGMQNKR